jgi:methionine-S-sulfoxide reductase
LGAVPGIWRTRVGYTGGTLKDPTYRNLGDHTESFQVDFDPARISYERLLDFFWSSHNPCGGSWSRQYMSAVFVHDEAQRKAAEASRDKVAEKRGSVKTPILKLEKFYVAEDYHQKWELRNHKTLMREFEALYPKDADFMNSTSAARVNGYLGGGGTKAELEKEIDRLGLSEAGKKVLRAYVTK